MGLWSAAFQALGSTLSSRSAGRQSAAQRQRELEMAADRNQAMWERGNDLEDRRYRQESFANYRQFNTDPGLMGNHPEFSSTTPTPIALPQAIPKGERPRKGETGLGYWR